MTNFTIQSSRGFEERLEATSSRLGPVGEQLWAGNVELVAELQRFENDAMETCPLEWAKIPSADLGKTSLQLDAHKC